jgi:hypothetical protein
VTTFTAPVPLEDSVGHLVALATVDGPQWIDRAAMMRADPAVKGVPLDGREHERRIGPKGAEPRAERAA